MTANTEEQAYMNLLRRVIDTGSKVPTRNGDRHTVIGEMMKFSLKNGQWPLMTARKIPLHLIITELIWFLSGNYSVAELHLHNNHIWDKWAVTQEAIDVQIAEVLKENTDSEYEKFVRYELDSVLGSIGPIYGAHWNDQLHSSQGSHSQLTRLISELKARPYSTQHLLTSYNPDTKMNETKSSFENVFNGNGALTPCHGIHTQFICLPPDEPTGKPKLHCIFTNRSQDLPVGTVFNIAMYGLLTHLIAQICDFDATELTWIGAHCHIYPNQFEAMETMLKRTPGPFPQIIISSDVKELSDFKVESVIVVNYLPQPPIKVPVTS